MLLVEHGLGFQGVESIGDRLLFFVGSFSAPFAPFAFFVVLGAVLLGLVVLQLALITLLVAALVLVLTRSEGGDLLLGDLDDLLHLGGNLFELADGLGGLGIGVEVVHPHRRLFGPDAR